MKKNHISEITPGMYIMNEKHKEWGVGQVQSSIHEKVTINFKHVGKKVININEVTLKILKLNEFS